MTSKTAALSPLVEALSWRYATKKFDHSKKIPADQWRQLEEALRLSASSFGLQPYRFVIITDQSVKLKLQPAAWNQAQVADCSHFVVFARLTDLDQNSVEHYLKLISETRNLPIESLGAMKDMLSGFVGNATKEELANWMARQCYIALGNLIAGASMLRIDNCPMEGIVPEQIDQILGLPEKGCTSVVACALGYRAEDDKYARLSKVRLPESELLIRI